MGKTTSGLVFLLVGLAMLGVLMWTPLWNAVHMLNEASYMYLLGDAVPGCIVIMSMAVVLFYVFVIAALYGRPQKAAAKEQNMLQVAGIFVALLAGVLILSSGPIRWTGLGFMAQAESNCAAPGPMFKLATTWRELHTLRTDPTCSGEGSVELCAGFQPSEEATMLRTLEDTLQCSGWCTNQTAALAAGIVRGFTPKEFQAAEVFPPTLFSRGNFQATCDGMAARSFLILLQDTADGLFYEGVTLLSVFAVVGLLAVHSAFGERASRKRDKDPFLLPNSAVDYGTKQRHAQLDSDLIPQ